MYYLFHNKHIVVLLYYKIEISSIVRAHYVIAINKTHGHYVLLEIYCQSCNKYGGIMTEI